MNVVPRVEQQWETLYPDFNVDALLEIRNYEQEYPIRQSQTRKRPKRFDDIIYLPLGGPPRYSTVLNRIGYSSDNPMRENLHYNTASDFENVFPGNLLARDARFGIDSLELCEYDMDEQDMAFLGFLITEYQAPLNAELFEYLMSVLELEMYKLEMLLPMQPLDVPDEIRACTVCGDTEGQNLNAILFCDGCDLAVHQDCYGVPFIPDGQWLCRQCQAHRGEYLKCQFCPHTSGAFKQLSPQNTWGHVVCAIWIPELHLGNTVLMEPIQGYKHIHRDRWRLRCMICRERGGACIQCTHGDCSHSFHATCAQAAGLYMKMQQGVYGAINMPSSLEVYCPSHTPIKWAGKVNIMACTQQLEQEREARIKAQSTRNQYPFWRTSQGTMIIPARISNALPDYVRQRFNLDIDPLVIERVCRYWLLKREKTCSPFSRRLRIITDKARHDELTSSDQLPINKIRQQQLEILISIVDNLQGLSSAAADTLEAHSDNVAAAQAETSVALTPPLSPQLKNKDALYETVEVEPTEELLAEPNSEEVGSVEAQTDDQVQVPDAEVETGEKIAKSYRNNKRQQGSGRRRKEPAWAEMARPNDKNLGANAPATVNGPKNASRQGSSRVINRLEDTIDEESTEPEDLEYSVKAPPQTPASPLKKGSKQRFNSQKLNSSPTKRKNTGKVSRDPVKRRHSARTR